MPLSVMVRTNTGVVEGRCTDRAVQALCDLATEAGLPLLGHVDPYDNTVFNQMQMTPLIRELEQLADTAPPAEAETARDLIALTDLVARTPHRYLVFLGD